MTHLRRFYAMFGSEYSSELPQQLVSTINPEGQSC
jgi:hypothetical protein